MINLKELITKYPECLENVSKLRSYLLDLYPDEKRDISVIVTILECGIADEIKAKNGNTDDIQLENWCLKLENNYAYAKIYSEKCIKLWIEVYNNEKHNINNSNTNNKQKSNIERTKSNSVYTRTNNTVHFGLYPQTQITDKSLINRLNNQAGEKPTPSNNYSWIDYNYYIDGKKQSYMWYLDITYGCEKYRGIYFAKYRPSCTDDIVSYVNSNQYGNGYKKSTIYWFKWEPIKWNILTEKNGRAFLITDLLLDAQHYNSSEKSTKHNHNEGKGFSNNYELSDIRQWLNNVFYDTAFNDIEKSIIDTALVDNSESSIGYIGFMGISCACNNTNDKVFMISRPEVNTYFISGEARKVQGTDYAKSQGLFVSSNCGSWWLRSPNGSNGMYACGVDIDTIISAINRVQYIRGVRPAVLINI